MQHLTSDCSRQDRLIVSSQLRLVADLGQASVEASPAISAGNYNTQICSTFCEGWSKKVKKRFSSYHNKGKTKGKQRFEQRIPIKISKMQVGQLRLLCLEFFTVLGFESLWRWRFACFLHACLLPICINNQCLVY